MNKEEEDNEKEEISNSINIKILDSILEDDSAKFIQILLQLDNDDLNFNKRFKITNYQLPEVLSSNPTYSSLCSFFGSEKCFNALISLFPEGINSNFFKAGDDKGRKPIHFACMNGNLNILRQFYQEEFDFNISDNYGQKPSHYSAKSGTSDAIKYLWMKGIDVLTQTDIWKMTPFHIACKYGNVEIVKFLYEKVANFDNKLFESKNGYLSDSTPLHLACENGYVDVVDYILSKKEIAKKLIKTSNYNSHRPIDCAIENGNLKCIKSLVKFSITNLNIHSRKHILLVDAASLGYTDIIMYLLKQKKININEINSDKINALDAAILNGHIDIINILIKNGITKDYDDERIGNTFMSAFNDLEIVKFLDEKLKIPYINMGKSFMKKAISIEDKDLIDFLLDKKCTFKNIESITNFTNKWTPFMTYLREKGFDFTHCTDGKSVPLIVRSINRGNLLSIQKLIDEGIELNSEIISKYDCIDTACKSAKFDLFNFLLRYNPKIKNINNCLMSLTNKYNLTQKNNKPNIKIMSKCIEMATILIDKLEGDINENIIHNVIYNCSLEFLELFSTVFTNFDDICLDYTRMISKEFIPIFTFLEQHGCTFQKMANNHFSYYTYYNSFKSYRKCIKNSPVRSNMTQIWRNEYDVSTLIFLLKYAKNEDLIYSYFQRGDKHQNVIDVLLSFECFDSIIEIYKKLNHVLYPKCSSKDEFLTLIKESEKIELINILDSFEEEEEVNDEESNNYYSFNNQYSKLNKLKRLRNVLDF